MPMEIKMASTLFQIHTEEEIKEYQDAAWRNERRAAFGAYNKELRETEVEDEFIVAQYNADLKAHAEKFKKFI